MTQSQYGKFQATRVSVAPKFGVYKLTTYLGIYSSRSERLCVARDKSYIIVQMAWCHGVIFKSRNSVMNLEVERIPLEYIYIKA